MRRHIVALNGNGDQVGGFGEGSEQLGWLRVDIVSSRATCTPAMVRVP